MKQIAFIVLTVSIAHAQTTDKYYGKFLGLQADSAHMYERVLKVGQTQKKFVPPLDSKAIIATGKLNQSQLGAEILASGDEETAGGPGGEPVAEIFGSTRVVRIFGPIGGG